MYQEILSSLSCDLSDDPKSIPKLVKKIEEGYDIAYRSRFIKGGSIEDYPRLKIFANRFFNNAVRFLFGISRKDVTNAFKAYKREVLDEISIENIEAEGFDLTVELKRRWLLRQAGISRDRLFDLLGNTENEKSLNHRNSGTG